MSDPSPEPDDLPAHLYMCRQCGGVYPLEVLCPRCWPPPDHLSASEEPPKSSDILRSVLMAVIVIVLTFLPSLVVLDIATQSTWQVEMLIPFSIVSFWNGYLLGFPLILLIRRWRQRVHQHQFGYQWIWREYWQVQWLAILPILIVAIFPALMVMGYWIQLTFMR